MDEKDRVREPGNCVGRAANVRPGTAVVGALVLNADVGGSPKVKESAAAAGAAERRGREPVRAPIWLGSLSAAQSQPEWGATRRQESCQCENDLGKNVSPLPQDISPRITLC